MARITGFSHRYLDNVDLVASIELIANNILLQCCDLASY